MSKTTTSPFAYPGHEQDQVFDNKYEHGEPAAVALVALGRASSSGRTNGCWMVPLDQNPRFVGRQPQLEELEKRIFVKGQSQKAAITGLGGVGDNLFTSCLLFII
jgi:hypothetical protein